MLCVVYPMSDLQRKAQRRAINATDSSRPTSRQSSRANSKAGSKNASAYASDDEDDEYYGNSFLSTEVDPGQLANDLKKLSLEEEQQQQHQGPQNQRDKFSSAVELLLADRRSTSLDGRQNALKLIVSCLSQKYDPEKYQVHGLARVFAKAFATCRSDNEAVLAVKALCIVATMDIDDTCEFLSSGNLLTLLLEKLTSDTMSISARANLMMGYSLLQYLANFGSGGYKIDSIAEELIDTANGLSLEEGPIAVAALLGSGLLISILSGPNSVICDFLPILVDFLEFNGSPDVRAAASKVIALFYQLYDYESDDDDDDNYNDEDDDTQEIPLVSHSEILARLRELSGAGIRKISKKDKMEQKSLFRDVSRFIELYTSHSKRDNIVSDDLIITHVKLSKSKSLSIDSWAKLLVLQHFKWAFGPGIHTQIANNPMLQECLQASAPPLSIRTQDYGTTLDSADAKIPDWADANMAHRIEGVARTKLIRSQRLQKELDRTFAHAES